MKKFKKIIFLVCFVMLIAVMAIAVSAYDKTDKVAVDLGRLPAGTTVNGEAKTGTVSLPLYDSDGDALTYYLNGTDLVSIKTKKIAYISGEFLRLYGVKTDDPTGIIADTKVDRAKIVVLNMQDDTLNKVEHIQGDRVVIQNSSSLQYIYFADSTKSFAAGVTFQSCTNLKGVYFGENSKLTELPSKTFYLCTSLTEVILPPSLEKIHSAFWECSGLKEIYIPASVTSLFYSFSGCKSLEKVVFAEGSKLTVIDQQSFENCSKLKSLNIPDGVTKIGTKAFFGCTLLPSISLNNVTEIGELAFRSCTSLTELTLPNIKTIAQYAFKGCTGLTTVSIPSSALESLGIEVFMECTSLESIVFAKEAKFTVISSKTFYKCQSLKSITLPNTVTTIGFSSFGHCYALEYVNLGASVTTFETDGNNCNAFYNCNNLKTLIMPATIVFNGTEKQLFDKASKTIKFFFTGTKDDVVELQKNLGTAGSNTAFTSITNIQEYDENKNYESLSGPFIIYNYNPCTAFYGDKHDVSGEATCTDSVVCARCKEIATAALGHEFDIAKGATVVKIQYLSGFDKLGTKTIKCARCDAKEAEATPSAPVIFEADGYSVKNDNSSIYGGFRVVDKDALAEYEKVNGPIKYGVIISNVTGLSGINFVEGVIDNEKSIQVEIKDRTFSRFGFSINNFNEATKTLQLVISAYVIDEEGNVSFIQKDGAMDGSYYLNGGITANGDTLGIMTLEQVVALTPAQTTATAASETKENA